MTASTRYLGNPPWEIAKPNSLEFFSRHDPLYRTYGKTEALAVQRRLFDHVPGLETDWIRYRSGFKALSQHVKASASPFDITLPGGKSGKDLAAAWEIVRDGRQGNAHRDQPYRQQGSADLNTYKLFLEMAHHLVRGGGRIGMLVPSGIATDKGTTSLRRLFLDSCRWEWGYGFENRDGLFPIHGGYKFNPIIIERGGHTKALNVAFARTDVREWQRPEDTSLRMSVADIGRFSPATRSLMEFREQRDIDIVEQMYSRSHLLGELVSGDGASPTSEFHMTAAAGHFTSLVSLRKREVVSIEDDVRDPRVRAKLAIAGYLPLYEGKSYWLHNPYALGAREKDSVSLFVPRATAEEQLSTQSWKGPRPVYRPVTHSSTNQRTMITALMPPGVHGNSSPSIDGLRDPEAVLGVLGSLSLDYVVRMKVYVNVNWFHAETFPIPRWRDSVYEARGAELVRRLIMIGADFGDPATDPLIDPADRLAARLLLDAFVADLYGLHPDDLEHIATRFPIYDKHAGDHRYTSLSARVYEVMFADGPDAAALKAASVAASRRAAGVGFALDELWRPQDGWGQANREAQELLAEAEALA